MAATALAQEPGFREEQILDPQSRAWVTATQPAEPAADEFSTARELLADGKPTAARKLLKRWTHDHPDHERYADGAFLYGEACFEAGDFWAAYEQYEYVVENSSGDLFQKALSREVDVARAFLSGRKRMVWKIFRVAAYDEAIEMLDRVWERAPGTQLGELALRLKADYFFDKGDMDLAQDEYAALAREYPSGHYIRLAMLRSAVAAEATFPGVRFDSQPLVEADERYRQLEAAFPHYAERNQVDARLAGIREQRATKDLEIARWYERTRRPQAAVFYYQLVLHDWPDTLAASQAQRRLELLGAPLSREEDQP